ncbi:MAG TPA: glycosyltransferase family 39 protein [Candidatus Limnocylindria bacterium]
MHRQKWGTRLLAAGTGLCSGISAGFLITEGDLLGLVAAGSCVAAALGLSYAVLSPASRRQVLPLVTFATLLRVMAAVVLYDGLLAAGRGGFVTGDDAGYFDLSSRLAQILHGGTAAFDYKGESYLLGTFVYLETAVFYIFGPKVLLVELLNAAMGGLLVAFAFEIARRLFEATAGVVAAVLVAIYPSLVLWSALNLKDSLTLALIALVLWTVLLFQEKRAMWLIPAAFAPLVLMESLRNYIFVGLILVIPAAIAFTPRLRLKDRAIAGFLAVGLAVLLLVTGPTGTRGGIPSLAELEAERAAMGVGANTSFAEPLPTPPTAGSQRTPGESAGSDEVVVRTFRYLPRAAAYVLFAPFPWSARRTLDLAVLPEMLIWYLALGGALFVLVWHRRTWGALVPLIFFVGGTLLVLALAEGNVGTLFRHRAMVIPFVLILASPAFALLFSRSAARSPDVARARVWTAGDGRTGRIG